MIDPTFPLGIVEGFFGRQWDWQARKDVAGFLAAQRFNSYIYAPKNDGYFRKQWYAPCPDEHLLNLQNFSNHVRQLGLDFGIGLSPFEVYRDFSAVNRAALQNKIAQINEIAPQTLCILFDDMMGNLGDLARVQLDIADLILRTSTAQSFIVCPTYYSDDPLLVRHFGEKPQHYLEDLCRGLDSRIKVFWTGPKVISSSYPREHLENVAARLNRKPLLWDNYPVNDAKRLTSFLHLHAFTGRTRELAGLVSGHLANPMNQALLSQIPLHSLAALYADTAYQPQQAFIKACTSLCPPPLADALIQDADIFQQDGLEAFSAQQKASLIRKYSELNHPMAEEVCAWLRGEFAFDPACLT
jgi:hypothetical protein